ncbi:39S mitochondrial ribosomal protein L46-domain-containing protein [Suillus fuscotomentosus]|uniref:Large ribosomal subunit protein mL46 n=1 Tax=Suillus fuscotomentosus TaxID=1912939 RepID=A0AAD4EFK0_9AGAM|nr:39S mitochondrial ribosomal protein L46-domain-containing protein [Suillus fuscotomentosus]KAG1904069.1 39S mitochondrial ribosomal protein L46-domain-containing protein [Suillus fuscotomentosus]
MFSRTVLSSCKRAPQAHEVAQVDAALSKKTARPKVHTGIILNRSPIITRTPTAFEKAYYAYQTRIHRALHNPFPYDFYFKQGSPLESRFNIEERRRERKAEAEKLAEATMRDEEEAMPRVHEADINSDFKNLNRRGQRNLYLLLQKQENGTAVWKFPQGIVDRGELLHHAATRGLEVECGNNMDTWIVSRNPIGVFHPPSPASTGGAEEDVVFFYKAHIMAGQVRPNRTHTQDFAWLTKGEIKTRVDEDYWLGIKDILSDF